MIKKLPNQNLFRLLIERYYQSPSDDEKKYISSYWDQYSQSFNIDIDGQGNIISMTGSGFGGSCKWGGGWAKRIINKTLDRACITSHLIHLRNRRKIINIMSKVSDICRLMNLDLTMDVFRQVCTMALIKEHMPAAMENKSLRVIMIGDGYGVLSAIFKEIFPDSSIALVDIGKSLLFQAYYCQKAHPDKIHEIAGNADLVKVDFLYCPTENLDMLSGFSFDLAINIASMQEMNDHTVKRYFSFLRKVFQKDNLLYCCNRLSKKMPGGEVSEFFRYPWRDDDSHLVEELCPWHKYYFSVHRALNGLSIMGIRMPFINNYDGKVFHRLSVLSLS